MNNTYSYFYRGTTLPSQKAKNIKKIPLKFLQPSIEQESRAVLIEVENDPLVDSILMIEFFHSSDKPYVLTVLNCSRILSTKKTGKIPDEVWQMKSKYSQYIEDCYSSAINKALYVPHTQAQEEVSQFFRNSNTLKFETCNTYETEDVTLNISEFGFAMRYPYNLDRSDRYKRLLILQALMLVYEQYMQGMNSEMMQTLDSNKGFDTILELRNKMAHFNAKYYFLHPVNHKFHELYAFHKLMVKKMNIQQSSAELASNIKALEEISKIESEKKSEKFHKTMVVLGLVITLISIPDTFVKWIFG